MAYSGDAMTHSAGAVDHAGGIAGMVDVVDLQVRIGGLHQTAEGQALLIQRHVIEGGEGGFQLTQALQGGLGPGVFLIVEGQAAVVMEDRDQALGEVAIGQGVGRPALAFQGQLVHVVPGEAFQGGDHVAADALVGLGVDFPQVGVQRIQGRAGLALQGRAVGHALNAAGDDQVLGAGHDAHGRQIDRREARAAETVKAHAWSAHVKAGVQGRHAGDAGALLAALGAATGDDVVDLGGVEAIAIGQGLSDCRQNSLRVDIGQSPLVDLADSARRAGNVDDPGFTHSLAPEAALAA